MARPVRLLAVVIALALLGQALRRLLAEDSARPPAESPAPPARPAPVGASNGVDASSRAAPTRKELYEEAKGLAIEGRSSMSKAELEEAVSSKRSEAKS